MYKRACANPIRAGREGLKRWINPKAAGIYNEPSLTLRVGTATEILTRRVSEGML
jgi:hypothetical protein